MSRAVTMAGWVVLAGALAVHEAAARVARRRGGAPRTLTFGEAVGVVMSRPLARWLALAGWLWLGWHVFARVDWR